MCPVSLSSIVARRCLGRRAPSLRPSSSLMRSTLSPVREEGTLCACFLHTIESGPAVSTAFKNKTSSCHFINVHFLSLKVAADRWLLFSALRSRRRCGLFLIPRLTKTHSKSARLRYQSRPLGSHGVLSDECGFSPPATHRTQSCPEAL